MLKDIAKQHSHHALLVLGDPTSADEVFVTFGIDDAHELARRSSFAVAESEEQVFCIGVHGFTREAQNALLKLFEEPMPGTRFIIVTPYPDDLLPTLRSRLFHLEALPPSELGGNASKFDAKDFLVKTPVARLNYLERDFFSQRDEDDETHARTKYDAGAILTALELYYKNNKDMVTKDETGRKAFAMLVQSKQYIHDTSPAVKLILESLALHLPRIGGGQAM